MSAGHYLRYYACGRHVEEQCRCIGPKDESVGNVQCPTCAKGQVKPPTCRELLEKMGPEGRQVFWRAAQELAARVEAVLQLAAKRHASEAYDAALRDVLARLNGERE